MNFDLGAASACVYIDGAVHHALALWEMVAPEIQGSGLAAWNGLKFTLCYIDIVFMQLVPLCNEHANNHVCILMQ